MSKEGINDADFVNLANGLVGTGLLYSGQKNYELAKEYAKEVAIGYDTWKREQKFNWNGVEQKWVKWETVDGKTSVIKKTDEQLYQQYLNQRS